MIGPSWWNRPAVVAGVSARYRGLAGRMVQASRAGKAETVSGNAGYEGRAVICFVRHSRASARAAYPSHPALAHQWRPPAHSKGGK